MFLSKGDIIVIYMYMVLENLEDVILSVHFFHSIWQQSVEFGDHPHFMDDIC